MSVMKWVYQYAVTFAIAFTLLFTVAIARGRTWEQALLDSAVWGAISAGVFIAARIYRRSRGEYCVMCGDEVPGGERSQSGTCNIKS